MKNPLIWLIFACIVIGLLTALCAFQGCQKLVFKKQASDYQLRLNACLNAPKTADTVHDTIWSYDTTWIKLKGKTEFIHDTTVKYCQAYYDSTYKFQGQGRIHYVLSVKDCNASIQFKDIVGPKEIITITQHVDTCITKPPEYRAKFFHWGLYTDLTVNSFKQFPGIGLGGQIVIKDQVTIGIGGIYMDRFYGNLRIGVLFKK